MSAERDAAAAAYCAQALAAAVCREGYGFLRSTDDPVTALIALVSRERGASEVGVRKKLRESVLVSFFGIDVEESKAKC